MAYITVQCATALVCDTDTVRRNRKSEIQDGGLQSGNMYISTCRHDRNGIPTVIPMFSGQVIQYMTARNTMRPIRK